MRRFSIILLMLLPLLLWGSIYQSTVSEGRSSALRYTRPQTILFFDGFEEGSGSWSSTDGTQPLNWNEQWHIHPENGGHVWWMGDNNIGGYTNHRYLSLETPTISLDSSPGTLSFDVTWNMETASGDYPAGYDSWDGCNVRISTDDGQTWTVVEGLPGYNSNSCWAFGDVFEEGAGIPVWTGDSGGWQTFSMSLAAWAGQSIRVRFTFASDDATATDDGGQDDWFGMKVDNISIGDAFFSDAEGADGDSQMIPGFGSIPSGDFWALSQEMPQAGDYCMTCPNQPHLVDWLISGQTSGPVSASAHLEYHLRWNNPEGIEGYLEVSAKGYGEDVWTRLHRVDSADLGSENWRLIDPVFASEHFGDHDGNCDFSVWSGQRVQLRFAFHTFNDSPAVGALSIDNVTIYDEEELPAPSNLETTLEQDGVTLTWEAPEGGGWLHWDDGSLFTTIGTGEMATMDVAIRFTPEDLAGFQSSDITSVRFIPTEELCDYTVRIWAGTNGATELYSQAVPNPHINQWNDVQLDTPVPVPNGTELWIGYTADTETGFPCGVDAGPMVPDRGGYIRMDGEAWQQLTENNPDLSYNWNIQAWVNQSQYSINGYRVYRTSGFSGNWQQLTEINDETQLWHFDHHPLFNTYDRYRVHVLYDDAVESAGSNVSSLYVPGPAAVEYGWDDDVVDGGYTPQPQEEIALRFSPQIPGGQGYLRLFRWRVWLEDPGTQPVIFRVRADSNHQPGALLAEFVVSPEHLQQGWNWLFPPTDQQPDFDDMYVYFCLVGSPGGPTIGVDAESAGYSVSRASGGAPWTDFTDGGFMMRLIGNTNTDAEEEVIPPSGVLQLSNAPNPFNPETMIRFNLPQSGLVRLEIYNVRGQLVRRLHNGIEDAGMHEIVWNGRNDSGVPLSSGVYFVRLQTAAKTRVHRMVLMK